MAPHKDGLKTSPHAQRSEELFSDFQHFSVTHLTSVQSCFPIAPHTLLNQDTLSLGLRDTTICHGAFFQQRIITQGLLNQPKNSDSVKSEKWLFSNWNCMATS